MISTNDKLSIFQQLVACANPILFTQYDAQTFQVFTDDAQSVSLLNLLFSIDSDPQPEMPYEVKFEDLYISNGYHPIVCTNSLGMIWISEIEERNQRPYRIHVLGPAFVNDYSSQFIMESLSRHHLSKEIQKDIQKFVTSIPVVSIIRFYEYGTMLHWCLTGEKIDISELMYIDLSKNSDLDIKNQAKQHHGTYLAEQRMLKAVHDGNLQYYKKLDNFASTGYTEQILSQNNLRYIKNYVIIYTALCCRAAVDGGLDVETAYTMSDQYLEKIENSNQLSSLHKLSDAMVRDYIEHVRRAKYSGSLSPQIRMACEWITLEPQLYNIHNLAEKLGYTDYYFSKLFKKETGKSVNEYILAQKIEVAKELLISTTKSVAEITDILAIESQSYFTARFREATGMTPKAYRTQKRAPAPYP